MSRESASDFLAKLTNTTAELVIIGGHAVARGRYRHAYMYGIRYEHDGETRIMFWPDEMVPLARKAVYVLNGTAHYVAGWHDTDGFVIVHPIDPDMGRWFDPSPRAYVWAVTPASVA